MGKTVFSFVVGNMGLGNGGLNVNDVPVATACAVERHVILTVKVKRCVLRGDEIKLRLHADGTTEQVVEVPV